jgi:hypothetical protein
MYVISGFNVWNLFVVLTYIDRRNKGTSEDTPRTVRGRSPSTNRYWIIDGVVWGSTAVLFGNKRGTVENKCAVQKKAITKLGST